tara:strand:+ start:814 stop:1542 length:729 start_codon:yes stop_codon:yes gene_type:complete
MNIVTIEARMASTRLPGKIMMNLQGKPIIQIIYEKAKRIKEIDKVIVATTKSKTDDVLEEFCIRNNMNYFRGEEDNVWQRLRTCVEINNAKFFVKLTGDNPFIDIEIINEAFDLFLREKYFDILCLSEKRSLPIGLDFEIVKAKVFCQLYSHEASNYDKEHATTYLKKQGKRFDFVPSLKISNDFIRNVELTIDNKEDFIFANKLLNTNPVDINNIKITKLYDIFKEKKIKNIGDRKWTKGY